MRDVSEILGEFEPPKRETSPEWSARLAEYDAEERAKEQRANEARWRACGVGERVSRVVDACDETQAVHRVRQWLSDRHGGDPWALVLSADKGLGKTVAAALWMRELKAYPVALWRDGKTESHPCWWPVAKLARMSGYTGVFEALCAHRGPIVIDDLGSEFMDAKGWFSQALDGLVDARYADMLPLCITTNQAADRFRTRYGERVTDRLREGGVFFEFKGESLRGAA